MLFSDQLFLFLKIIYFLLITIPHVPPSTLMFECILLVIVFHFNIHYHEYRPS